VKCDFTFKCTRVHCLPGYTGILEEVSIIPNPHLYKGKDKEDLAGFRRDREWDIGKGKGGMGEKGKEWSGEKV